MIMLLFFGIAMFLLSLLWLVALSRNQHQRAKSPHVTGRVRALTVVRRRRNFRLLRGGKAEMTSEKELGKTPIWNHST
jgi:hypothetical protein